jgi:Tol biopolymer transport system component
MKNDGSQRVLFSALREALASTHCGRFVILAGENGRLMRTDADGPNPLELVHRFVGVTVYIRWKPDGRALAYSEVRDEIRQVVEQPLAGGAPRPVTNFTSGRVRDFDWSLDGKTLYVSHGEVNGDAVLISNFR